MISRKHPTKIVASNFPAKSGNSFRQPTNAFMRLSSRTRSGQRCSSQRWHLLLLVASLVLISDTENSSIVCPYFSIIYKTFLCRKKVCFFLDGGNTALQVLAWPYNGRPGKVNVMRSSPNPATWIRAQVTFRKVDNFFIVLFRAVAPNENNLYMAIDDVSVTEGACN